MSRIYVSQLVGTGARGDRHRVRAHDLPYQRYETLGILSDAQGHPVKGWTLISIDAADFAPFDADASLVLLEDRVNLDNVPSTQQRNRINAFLSNKLAATTTALAGETYRQIANKLLTEIGSLDRL